MPNNNTDRLPCTVECEHCGELLCSDPTTTLCCAREKAISDGCTVPMWECAECKAGLDAETAAELELVAHPAVRANILADRVSAVPLPVVDYETEPTKVEPFLRDADLPRPRASAGMFRAAVFVGVLFGMVAGCATARPVAAEADTVGSLSAGPSVWSAKVHPTTDLTPSFGAVEGDDDAGLTVSTVTRTDGGNSPVSPDGSELPEVAPKSDGVTTGAVR